MTRSKRIAFTGSLLTLVLTAGVIVSGPSALAVTMPEEVELDLTLSPAPVGTMVGGQTILAIPSLAGTQSAAVAVEPIGCSLDNDGGFAGTREGGQADGTFTYTALSECSELMVEIDVYAQLLKNGAGQDNSGHSTCRACPAATTGAQTHACNDCNGVWRIQSTHVFTFPAGYALVDYDRGRCSLASAVQVTCVVRSSKVRL